MNIKNRKRRSSVSAQSIKGNQLSRRHRPDYWIIIISAMLLTTGLVVIYSISPGLAAIRGVGENYYVTKQLLAIGLGIISFIVAATLPLDFWRKMIKPLIVVAILASIIALLTPLNDVYQAHRWLRFGGFSFQVAELIKLTLVLWGAVFLTTQWQNAVLDNFRSTLRPLLIAIGLILIVVAGLQSDLGSAAVMMTILAMMAFVAGVDMKKFALLGLVGLVAVSVFIVSSDYRRERFSTYLNPQSDCQRAGYQACQALIAVGSGGIFGLGLGQSVQAYGYLPEASNDSIFAIMAEKFGFLGVSLVIGLYGVLIARLKRIIERTSNQYHRLMVVGVMAWISSQAIVNIGAMIGLLPLKGITLPLISYGGTSLLFITCALGLVFNISRYTSYSEVEPEKDEKSKQKARGGNDWRGVGRAYNPNLVSRPRH